MPSVLDLGLAEAVEEALADGGEVRLLRGLGDARPRSVRTALIARASLGQGRRSTRLARLEHVHDPRDAAQAEVGLGGERREAQPALGRGGESDEQLQAAHRQAVR